MAYEYEGKLLDYASGSKTYEEYKVMTQELKEVYHKARAFDELKKHVYEEVNSYMDLYRQTKDPIYSFLNSHCDTLLGFIEELERADDEEWW